MIGLKSSLKNLTSPRKMSKNKPQSNSENHLCETKWDGKSKGLVNTITHNNPPVIAYRIAKTGPGQMKG